MARLEYALITPGPNREVIEYRTYEEPPEGTKVALHKPRLVPVEVDDPPFDPQRQVREGPALKVMADRVIRRWTVRDKDEHDLAAELDGMITGEVERINAERDARNVAPFAFDFGDAPAEQEGAFGSDGAVKAGVRLLQMDAASFRVWMTKTAQAATYKPEQTLLIRTLDNATLAVRADLWLACFDAMAKRETHLMEYAVQRKAAVRSQGSVAGVIGTQFSTNAGWPTE